MPPLRPEPFALSNQPLKGVSRMSINSSRLSLTRNAWIAFLLGEAALFVTANVTAQNASHPGTVSNVFFVAFIAGLVLAVFLGATELIRSRRQRTR